MADGFDPLAHAVDAAHARGIALHAWINPFRAKTKGTTKLAATHPYSEHPERFFEYDGLYIFDPGLAENREYICRVAADIVRRYDVDGLHIDDYFYPYGGTTTEDAKSKSLHKPSSGLVDQDKDGSTDDDWRRSNVDDMMKKSCKQNIGHIIALVCDIALHKNKKLAHPQAYHKDFNKYVANLFQEYSLDSGFEQYVQLGAGDLAPIPTFMVSPEMYDWVSAIA